MVWDPRQNTPRYMPVAHPESALAHWLGPVEISHHLTVHNLCGRSRQDYVDLTGLQTHRSSTSTHRKSWDLFSTGRCALTKYSASRHDAIPHAGADASPSPASHAQEGEGLHQASRCADAPAPDFFRTRSATRAVAFAPASARKQQRTASSSALQAAAAAACAILRDCAGLDMYCYITHTYIM